MPALYVCIAFIIGISANACFQLSLDKGEAFTLCLLLILVSVFLFNRHTKLSLGNYAILTLFIALGLTRSAIKNSLTESHFSLVENPSMLCGEISSSKSSTKTRQYDIDIRTVKSGDRIQTSSGRLKLIALDPIAEGFDNGIMVCFPASFKEVERNTNPNTFNYKTFLSRQYIYHIQYLQEEKIIQSLNTNGFNYKLFLSKLRSKIKRLVFDNVENSSVRQIIIALTIGVKDNLDQQLRDKYITSGTVHVLAISGLHVGTIAGLFILLLARIDKRNHKFKLVVIILAIGTVYLFAFLTGFSQSVARASFMFAIVIIGRFFPHRIHGLNILCVVAFVLLYWDPNNLFAVSFQFSFLAVLSIILFYDPIRSFLPDGKFGFRYVFDLLAISLAAQLLIAPLSMYYFHQLSFVGFIASVFVVPLTGIILQSALIATILGLLGCAFCSYIFSLTEYLVSIQNNIVSVFAELSFANIENICLQPMDVLLMYLFILSFLISIYSISYGLLWFVFILCVIKANTLFRLCQAEDPLYHYAYSVRQHTYQDLCFFDNLLSIYSADIPSSVVDYQIKNNQLSLQKARHIKFPIHVFDHYNWVVEYKSKTVVLSHDVDSCLIRDFDIGLVVPQNELIINSNL